MDPNNKSQRSALTTCMSKDSDLYIIAYGLDPEDFTAPPEALLA